MSLLPVQVDGTPTNADTYVDLADANQYLTRQGINVTLTEESLLQAMVYLDGLNYKGVKILDTGQPLLFPRIIDTLTVSQSLIRIGNAQALTAAYIIKGRLGFNHTKDNLEGVIKREKVDVLEIEYGETSKELAYDSVFYTGLPMLEALLSPLLLDPSNDLGKARIGYLDRA